MFYSSSHAIAGNIHIRVCVDLCRVLTLLLWQSEYRRLLHLKWKKKQKNFSFFCGRMEVSGVFGKLIHPFRLCFSYFFYKLRNSSWKQIKLKFSAIKYTQNSINFSILFIMISANNSPERTTEKAPEPIESLDLSVMLPPMAPRTRTRLFISICNSSNNASALESMNTWILKF